MKQLLLVTLLFSLFGLARAQSTDQSGNGDLVENGTSFNNTELELKNVVEFFPNPAKDFLNVEIKNSDLVKVEFELYDIIGNKINVQPEKISDTKFKIPVSELHVGYYMLLVKDPYSRFKKISRFGVNK